jgi:ornithine cyclodeaminase
MIPGSFKQAMRHLDAAALARATPWPALVGALRQAFEGGCVVPPRQVHALGSGTALLMPAWREGRCFGVKTVTIFPDNRARGLPGVHAVYTLFDATNGVPLAVLDGSELTARRTAAASALAADFLARRDATRLLLVGAGRVASLLPAALRCVRPGLREVTVWNRSPAAAAVLTRQLEAEGWVAHTTADLDVAAHRCDIVSCATMSTTALVQGRLLLPGTHVDLVGSFTPAMREADGRTFARGRVFVDTEEALAKSGDLLKAQAEGEFDPANLQATLAALCRGDHPGRGGETEITIFKSVGTALEDLAAAELALAAIDNPPPSA